MQFPQLIKFRDFTIEASKNKDGRNKMKMILDFHSNMTVKDIKNDNDIMEYLKENGHWIKEHPFPIVGTKQIGILALATKVANKNKLNSTIKTGLAKALNIKEEEVPKFVTEWKEIRYTNNGKNLQYRSIRNDLRLRSAGNDEASDDEYLEAKFVPFDLQHHSKEAFYKILQASNKYQSDTTAILFGHADNNIMKTNEMRDLIFSESAEGTAKDDHIIHSFDPTYDAETSGNHYAVFYKTDRNKAMLKLEKIAKYHRQHQTIDQSTANPA